VTDSAPKPRDQFPDYVERAGRMAAMLAAPALPIVDVALLLDIPLSTVDKLRAQGRGPKCFRIGRRLYVRQADLRTWLDDLAEAEAA
jgi:predicted DNA-binding transcriptional regulator AlpA